MRNWTYEPPVSSMHDPMRSPWTHPLAQRFRRFPREPDMLQYGVRALAALTIRAWLKLYHRFEIHGLERLPRHRSLVMVANHSSHLDALCLLSAIPLGRLHRAFPAAAADYFFESLPRTAISVLVMNALPFDRETHIRQSLALCRELLAVPGNILIVFPEGTRSPDGQVGPFRRGIGSLLAGMDVPVVPCYLSGAHDALPKGAWLPRPRRIRLDIAEAINFAHFASDRESVRTICTQMRDAVLAAKPGTGRTATGQSVSVTGSYPPIWTGKERLLTPR